MAKILMEFESLEELAAFTQGKGSGVAVAMPVVIANAHAQSIALVGQVGDYEGTEALIITVAGRGSEGQANVTMLGPGERRVVASP